MAIPNPVPQAKDVVILQRSDNNAFYGEAHLSGSKLILHIDSTGHINADDSASFYALYPPIGGGGGGGALVSGSTYNITASWANSASWAAFTAIANYSWASLSASWASMSLSTSYFVTTDNPNPVDQRTVVTDTTARDAIPLADRYPGLTTWVIADSQSYTLMGGLNNSYWVSTPISASHAVNADSAITATYAMNAGSGGGGATYIGVNHHVPFWWNNAPSTSSLITVYPNNVGINTISPDANDMFTVTELNTGSVLWTPTLLTIPVRFWYKADTIPSISGSQIDRWPDSSPYKNDATQSSAALRPTMSYNLLNGYPVVHFDGIDDRLAVMTPSSVSSSVVTAFVVGRIQNYTPSLTATNVGTIIGNGHPGNSKDFVIGNRFDGGLSRFTWTTYTEDLSTAYTMETPVNPYNAKTNEWYINTVFISASNSVTTLYLSGSVSSSAATAMSTDLDLRDLWIGYETSSNQPLDGEIAEIIVATASYTSDERQLVEGYLAWKYGLQSSLPTSHPFKLTMPTASVRGNIQSWRDYTGTEVSSVNADGLYVGTSSWAISSSWAPPFPSDYSISSSWASSSLSSSIAERSVTASSADTASWSISASWAPPFPSDYAISASWASESLAAWSSSFASHSYTADSASWASHSFTSDTASFASRSFSASYAYTTSIAVKAITSSFATQAGGSISSSWASRSFNADTASYATNANPNAISASWASSSFSASWALTASYSENLNPNAESASWASSSLSASYARTSSAAISASSAKTASWSVSASWAPPFPSDYAISASWASASFSASYARSASVAISASYAPPIPIDVATSASWASSSLSASLAKTASWAERSRVSISSSWASASAFSTTASYAEQASMSLMAMSASWAPTFGTIGTDNYHPKWQSNVLTTSSLVWDDGYGVGIGVTSSLQVDAKFTVIGGTPTSSVLWSPFNSTVPLRLWLMGDSVEGADSSSVSVWPDSGSYNNYFSQSVVVNQPTLTSSLNGHKIVRFDGISDRMFSVSGSTDIVQTSLCCFAVAKPMTYPVSTQPYSTTAVIGNGHAGNSRDFIVGPRNYLSNNEWAMYNESLLANYNITANASISQSWYILNGTVNGANSILTLYINGAATSSGVVNGSDNINLDDLYVGYEPSYGVPFNGDIAEIIITTQVLPANEQRIVEGYLAWKYGLTGSLPIDHPYRNEAPYALDASQKLQSWKNSNATLVSYVSGSGEYVGTASYAKNAQSASWAPPSGVTAFSISSSWASSSLSASWVDPAIGYVILYTGSVYQITSSFAQSASAAQWAKTASYAQTASWAINASSSRFAQTASWADVLDGLHASAFQLAIATGSFLPITSSFATSSSYSDTASWALNAINGGTQLATASTYPITTSWAESASWATYAGVSQWSTNSLSASWSPPVPTDTAISSSWASSSIWAQASVTADYALDSMYSMTASYARNAETGGLAINSLTADFALVAGWSFTASYASQSHFSETASYSLNAGTGGGAVITSGSYWNITASWADTSSTALTSSWANTASFAVTSSTFITYIESQSFASSSISASWADTSSWALNGGTLIVTASYYPITASWAETSSWAINAINGGTQLATASTYPITCSWAESASYARRTTTSSYAVTSSFAERSKTPGSANYFPIYQGTQYLSLTSSLYENAGQVGVKTTNPSYDFHVNGTFGATVKSFIIDHPTKSGKKLQYGSLESPYHGVRLTGRDKTTKKGVRIELPDYICKLVREENVNIQLTPIHCHKVFYVDRIDVENNCFYVKVGGGKKGKYYEFFWDFTAVRNDVPELVTEI